MNKSALISRKPVLLEQFFVLFYFQLNELHKYCNKANHTPIKTNCFIGNIFWDDLFADAETCADWNVVVTCLRKMIGEDKNLDRFIMLWIIAIARGCHSHAIQTELALAKRIVRLYRADCIKDVTSTTLG